MCSKPDRGDGCTTPSRSIKLYTSNGELYVGEYLSKAVQDTCAMTKALLVIQITILLRKGGWGAFGEEALLLPPAKSDQGFSLVLRRPLFMERRL